MSSLTDEQVMARLASLGLPLEYMSVLPGASEREGLIGLWYPDIGFRFLILEDEAVAKACYTYLLKHGARRFESYQRLLETAAKEKWPGWDTCEPSLQVRYPSDST